MLREKPHGRTFHRSSRDVFKRVDNDAMTSRARASRVSPPRECIAAMVLGSGTPGPPCSPRATTGSSCRCGPGGTRRRAARLGGTLFLRSARPRRSRKPGPGTWSAAGRRCAPCRRANPMRESRRMVYRRLVWRGSAPVVCDLLRGDGGARALWQGVFTIWSCLSRSPDRPK
jgi:hypothetical protein